MDENKPYICPVCNGRGHVPNGFYSVVGGTGWTTSSITPEICRSCNGTGIVWAEIPKWCMNPNDVKMSQ